jgi:hypothetical protein
MSPQQQGQQTVPPPPDVSGDPNVDTVGGTGDNGAMDRFRGIINRLSGGGTPAINKALEAHHAQVLADATRHSQVAKMYYRAAMNGKDPLTGKPGTPEDIEKWRGMGDAAWADYQKIAGKAKAAKPLIQQMGGILKHVVGGGGGGQQDAAGQQQGGAQPPAAGGPQAAPPGTPGTPIKGATPDAPWTGPVPYPKGQWSNPPQPGDAGGAGAAPATQGSQTVPPPPQGQPQPKATVPPPPGMNPLQESTMLETSAAAQKEQDTLRLKDEEYRNKLAADVDPKYHENKLKEAIADIKEAEPGISDEDARLKAETAVGITPKPKTGQEMEPDFKDGMPVGVKDKANNAYYTDPATMPPAAKAIWDSMQQVVKEHEDQQEAKEGRLLKKSIMLQTNAFNNALAASDYKAAKKILNTSKSDLDAALVRQDTMHKNLKAALNGDQQAMLSLVANHIGMTLGAQKGARITRAVWDEAASSTTWWDKKMSEFFHTDPATGDKVFDGWKRGITLAPEQMHQMVQLGDEKVDTLNKQVDHIEDEYSSDLGARGRGKTVSAPPDGKGPRVGMVEDGYKFKGGNPADKANWEKVQ